MFRAENLGLTYAKGEASRWTSQKPRTSVASMPARAIAQVLQEPSHRAGLFFVLNPGAMTHPAPPSTYYNTPPAAPDGELRRRHSTGSIRLTDQQERFCREYIIDLNAKQAAIRAGYSKRSVNSQGSQVL